MNIQSSSDRRPGDVSCKVQAIVLHGRSSFNTEPYSAPTDPVRVLVGEKSSVCCPSPLLSNLQFSKVTALSKNFQGHPFLHYLTIPTTICHIQNIPNDLPSSWPLPLRSPRSPTSRWPPLAAARLNCKPHHPSLSSFRQSNVSQRRD